jgi:acyl-[acyl carrier protein]--UDP-N-acetylglucosamine O-acyltransferase
VGVGTQATVDLRKEPRIDPHAIVSPQAELAADVTVGPFAVIDAEVVIGAGTSIGAHAVINGPTRIGTGNRIFQFASIGSDPQDKKYRASAAITSSWPTRTSRTTACWATTS